MAATSIALGGQKVRLTPDFFNTSDYQLQMKANFLIVFEGNNFLEEGIELLAQSVTPPTITIDSTAIPFANKNINIAGKKTLGTMTIVFRDVIGKDTELQFTKWHEFIVNTKTGERGIIGDSQGKNGYKSNIEIIALSPNGDTGRSNIARGCFPISLNFGDLSHEDGGHRTLNIEFAVDDYTRKEILEEI